MKIFIRSLLPTTAGCSRVWGRVKIVVVFESITLPSPVQDKQASPELQPDLSIIVVSWNVREHLVNCLRAICSPQVQGKLSVEVIVVDNASHDGSGEAAANFPLTLIENNENLGYGRANNAGLKRARGKHLMILNPDTIASEGSLEALVAFAESGPQAGIIAPRLLNPDGTVQRAAFRFPTLAMAVLDLFSPPSLLPGRVRLRLQNGKLNGRYPNEATQQRPFRIEHPLGAAFLLRREAYEQCGGFNEAIFMYSEEVDLALRYEAAGWECWQVPQAEITHLGGQSTRQMPDEMFVELWRSRLFVYDHYYALPARIGLRGILALAMLRDMFSARFGARFGAGEQRNAGLMQRARNVLRMAIGL